jgi:hypothetical protein
MIKKFYTIKPSYIPEATQLQCTEIIDSSSRDLFLKRIESSFNYGDVYHFAFVKDANPRDIEHTFFLSFAYGIFLNEKVRNILSKFEYLSNNLYPIKINNINQILDYYFLTIPLLPIDILDYKKSTFVCWSIMDGVIGKIEINSFEEYEQKAKELLKKVQFLIYEDIYLTEKFDENMAIFRLYPESTTIYLSECLMNELIEHKITGIDFEESSFTFNLSALVGVRKTPK